MKKKEKQPSDANASNFLVFITEKLNQKREEKNEKETFKKRINKQNKQMLTHS